MLGPFTHGQKREELELELRWRRRVYPRRIADGKMTKAEADRRIAILEEIAADYRDRDLFA